MQYSASHVATMALLLSQNGLRNIPLKFFCGSMPPDPLSLACLCMHTFASDTHITTLLKILATGLIIIMTILFTEDHSEPKFQLTASQRKQMDPVTLHIQQVDDTTVQAVQWFAKQIVMILHTCNEKGYWAALERLQPPTTSDQSNIRDRPIIYPQVDSVIGWFAGYRAAVVRTGQGNKCRDGLMKALTKSFPNSRVIIAAGIAYANNRKRKFADVLVSDQIENFVQYKREGDEIACHGPREEIDQTVWRIFEDSARDWTSMEHFICADDNRTSVAHIGCIVSAPTLIKDEVLRDQLMKHTPNAIGGEMEGWVLLELKRTLKDQQNIEVIVIKGVADYGDLSKGDKWEWTAAKAAMDCIHYCLNKSGGTEFSGEEGFHKNMNSSAKTDSNYRIVLCKRISPRKRPPPNFVSFVGGGGC